MNRVLPGLALVVMWLILLLQGSAALFALVLLLVLAVGAYEYGRMVLTGNSIKYLPLFLSVILLPLIFQVLFPHLGINCGLVVAFLGLAFLVIAVYREDHDNFGLLTQGVFGLVWIGFMGAHLYLIRTLPEGEVWLLILTAITAGSDSGAYYAGRAFGKHKLSPKISPKKTMEGAFGGIGAAIIASIGVGAFFLKEVPWLFIVFTAIVLAAVGICGDLAESVVKRATGTKDSGRILGGHGGVLDRGDSMLFAAPVLYYLLLLLSPDILF